MEEEPQTMIHFGIMGCARIARKISRAINLAPNCTLIAIASRSVQKAQLFASENGLSNKGEVIRVYGSYIELVNDPIVDVIYMPLPTSLHVEWAVLAASKKKHVLLEKPTALDSSQLGLILDACEANGVQFMDGTMWFHHPRTWKMKEVMSHPSHFGHVHWVSCTSSFRGDEEFLEKNIRVNPECDSLGALGDLGWYCIGAILWALNFQLPNYVTALPPQGATFSPKGIILSCNASLHWDQHPKTTATFYCSFLAHVSMGMTVCGSHGSLRLDDLAIPYRESSAGFQVLAGQAWPPQLEEVIVETRLPQEALMVQEFARLVNGIKSSGGRPENKWVEISKKTQLVLDAVRKSIDIGFKPVYL